MTCLNLTKIGKPRAEHGRIRPIDGIDIPFGIVEGAAPGPTLLVTAGVHGSEFCGIETALRLLRTPPERIRGMLVVLPIVNAKGFRARSIYVMPEDGRNLNRMFPGKADGTASERLAHWLVTEIYPHADAYIDLHSGDLDEALVPFSLFPSGSAKGEALAAAFGLGIAVEAGGEGYTINAASRIGLPGIIAEVGGNGLWNQALVGEMSDGIARVMTHLGMLREPAAPPPRTPDTVTMWVPSAPSDGLWYPAKELSDAVAAGETLGEIRDEFGTVLATIHSERTGFLLYRLTSLSVNRGEALLGIATPRGR